MIVPKKDYSTWRRKFRHGDATKIHAHSKATGNKVSRQAISGALNGSSVDQKTIDAINNYYNWAQ
jgi:hypothetical protein